MGWLPGAAIYVAAVWKTHLNRKSHMLNVLKKSLYVRGLTVGGALSLAVAGCGGPEAVETGAEALAVQESALIPKGTGALPTASQLQPLNVNTADRGRLLLASNNPETVTSYGILFSTQADPPSTVFRGDTAAYPYTASAPSAALPAGSSKALDSACVPGAVREIGVYIAHILGGGAATGHVALYVTPTASTTIEVTGDLASGPFNTTDPNFVSNKVTEDYFFNFNLPGVKRTVSVTGGRYTLIDVTGGSGGYFDGRLNLRAAAGCFHVHVVSQATNAAAAALPTTWARGNVKWPGWSGSSSFGTIAGVYAGDKVSGTQSFSLPGQGFLRGYIIGAVAQAYSAVYRYGDSASINFGNYGNFYDQTFTVTNSGSTCMRARAEFVSYANVPADQPPTYAAYNNLNPFPTMLWNGPLRFLTTSGTWSPVEDVILYPVRNTTTPTAIPPTLRHGIQERSINPGASGTFQFQFGVPGLIRAPAAVVFTTVAC
jgi:hypothetical protein